MVFQTSKWLTWRPQVGESSIWKVFHTSNSFTQCTVNRTRRDEESNNNSQRTRWIANGEQKRQCHYRNCRHKLYTIMQKHNGLPWIKNRVSGLIVLETRCVDCDSTINYKSTVERSFRYATWGRQNKVTRLTEERDSSTKR